MESMESGSLANQWTVLHQKEGVQAKDFYNTTRDLSPDKGDHLLVCLGGDYSASKKSMLPLRGVDGNYRDRWCSKGNVIRNTTTGEPIAVESTTPDELCNYYDPEELAQIPHISTNVAEALNFLGKDKDGFFLLYEQGDVSTFSMHESLRPCSHPCSHPDLSLTLIPPLVIAD